MKLNLIDSRRDLWVIPQELFEMVDAIVGDTFLKSEIDNALSSNEWVGRGSITF
jgi:hypothetical protein